MYLIKHLNTTNVYIKFSPLTTAQLLPSYLDMATHNTYGLTTTTFLLPHTRKTYSHARHSNTVIPTPYLPSDSPTLTLFDLQTPYPLP